MTELFAESVIIELDPNKSMEQNASVVYGNSPCTVVCSSYAMAFHVRMELARCNHGVTELLGVDRFTFKVI